MLEDLTPPSKLFGSCKVATIGATLSEQDREILFKAIADVDNWPVKSLARELRQRGLQLSDTPITNHRKRACACFRG